MIAIEVKGTDYAALQFEDLLKGIHVSDIILRLEEVKNDMEGLGIEVSLHDFKEVSPEFRSFIKSFIDCDHLKHSNYYFEDEKI